MAGERDLVTGVIQLANLFNRRLAPEFEKAKVTPQQWAVLTALSEEGAPMTLVALARRLVVTKQNMTGMITRLEQLEVAERTEDPHDLRSWRVQLTTRGRRIVERLRPTYDAWIRTLQADGELSESELHALARSVEKLITQLED